MQRASRKSWLVICSVLALALSVTGIIPVRAAGPLVALWHLDGNLTDSSGNGYTATLNAVSGDPAYSTNVPAGGGSNSLKFNGVNGGYASGAIGSELAGNPNFTVSFWISYTATLERQWAVFLGNPGTDTSLHWLISGSGDASPLVAQFGFWAGTQNSLNFAPYQNQWTKVETVYYAAAKRMSTYINGQLAQTATGTTTPNLPSNTLVGVGYKPVPVESYFSGALDEVQILDCPQYMLVTNTADTGVGSLRDAVANVCSGGTITFDSILAGQTITLTSELAINKNLTIDGGTNAITVSGDANTNGLADTGDVRLFAVNSGATAFMNGLILTHGYCAGCGGSAISNSGLLTITNSTLANNSNDEWGGAILNWPSGVLNIANTTLTGNRAGVVGGAIANLGDLTLLNSTLAGNGFITSGAGDVLYDQGTVTIKNSILTKDTGNACYIAGTVIASTNNLSDITCPGGSVVGDPLIGTLANNGGHTPTMALLPGSPAIDAGDAATCASLPGGDLDQRGVARHDGNADGTATCDIGAYEAGTMQCSVSSGNDYAFSDQSSVALHVTTATDLACLYVDEVLVNHPNATGSTNGQNLLTGKYWMIEGFQGDKSTTATGFDVNLTLPYSSADTSTRVCKWLEGAGGGYGWDCAVDSFTANTSVTRNGLTSLSQWAVGNTVGPTAVTLTDLAANSQPIDLPGLSALAICALLMTGLGGWWFARRGLKFR